MSTVIDNCFFQFKDKQINKTQTGAEEKEVYIL